jgi:IS5 family transposase
MVCEDWPGRNRHKFPENRDHPKAGVPVELGLRTCVVEDQHGFILHHQVMRKLTDDAIAVSIIEDTKQRFDALHSVSMDKGFHSAANQAELNKVVNVTS